MLFNSYVFIFLFLPTTLIGFYIIGARYHHRIAFSWLVAASLFFYGWWNPAYLSLIVASMLFNYAIGVPMGSDKQSLASRRALLTCGIAANLALLGYYKYANFFVDNLNQLAQTNFTLEQIILPLAISFFTFQQIAYLVDAYQGKTREYNFLHYCLFVTFFPQLIAGPIVHHREVMPQFADEKVYRFDINNLIPGATIFLIGLFKKVILADSISQYATPVFDAAAAGTPLTIFESWGGALAYTFQLYFDFSAYSDMAIGLGIMFGIRLPLNFYSPYKATSIIDFWRRWHITLSRFLRDYLYIPLGGNRKGPYRRQINLIITMLLGGLWHGAGWTFVLWGGLHGLYLVINHVWNEFKVKFGLASAQPTRASTVAGRAVTFFAVVVAWVLFRAENLDAAVTMYRGMFGFNGISLPESMIGHLGTGETWLMSMGVQFNGMFGNRVFEPQGVLWIILLSVIVWALPSLQDWMGKHGALRQDSSWKIPESRAHWAPSTKWAIVTGVAAGFAILGLSQPSEFLYFQF